MNFPKLENVTDNEIIQSFRFCKCGEDGDCKYCPFNKGEDDASCINDLMNAVADLINRQKAEIEKLLVDLGTMNGAANSYKSACEALKMDNEQLHSDIVNLSQNFAHVKGLWEEEKEKVAKAKQKVIDLFKKLKTAKTEGRKEFAERLRALFINISNDPWTLEAAPPSWAVAYDSACQDVDNLLEEMEGET